MDKRERRSLPYRQSTRICTVPFFLFLLFTRRFTISQPTDMDVRTTKMAISATLIITAQTTTVTVVTYTSELMSAAQTSQSQSTSPPEGLAPLANVLLAASAGLGTTSSGIVPTISPTNLMTDPTAAAASSAAAAQAAQDASYANTNTSALILSLVIVSTVLGVVAIVLAIFLRRLRNKRRAARGELRTITIRRPIKKLSRWSAKKDIDDEPVEMRDRHPNISGEDPGATKPITARNYDIVVVRAMECGAEVEEPAVAVGDEHSEVASPPVSPRSWRRQSQFRPLSLTTLHWPLAPAPFADFTNYGRSLVRDSTGTQLQSRWTSSVTTSEDSTARDDSDGASSAPTHMRKDSDNETIDVVEIVSSAPSSPQRPKNAEAPSLSLAPVRQSSFRYQHRPATPHAPAPALLPFAESPWASTSWISNASDGNRQARPF